MDPQFQELASEIADAVEKRLSGNFEQRLKTHVEEAVEQRLSGDFEERLTTSVEKRLSKGLEQRMNVHFENLQTTVALAAEGYGATLEKIERELADLNKKVDTKFDDHAAILRDHSRRIVELEKRR